MPSVIYLVSDVPYMKISKGIFNKVFLLISSQHLRCLVSSAEGSADYDLQSRFSSAEGNEWDLSLTGGREQQRATTSGDEKIVDTRRYTHSRTTFPDDPPVYLTLMYGRTKNDE